MFWQRKFSASDFKSRVHWRFRTKIEILHWLLLWLLNSNCTCCCFTAVKKMQLELSNQSTSEFCIISWCFWLLSVHEMGLHIRHNSGLRRLRRNRPHHRNTGNIRQASGIHYTAVHILHWGLSTFTCHSQGIRDSKYNFPCCSEHSFTCQGQ